jgi:phosphocarrier protein HPr
MANDLATDGTLVREIPIINQKGLHARASAGFVQTVDKFNAEVTVSRAGETVGGTSIMGLMMLAAAQGHSILIETEGPEAEGALEALIGLVEYCINEDD